MAANELSINQLSTVLNSIHSQATGKSAIAVTDTSSFVTVAQETLKAGYVDRGKHEIREIMST